MKKVFNGQLSFIKPIAFFLLFIFHSSQINAQCGVAITSFPYTEGFESGPAWTSGGTNNDWAWGTPAHPTISTAGGGTKSWCVGGLTGSSYNASQESYLMSPCFDFSSLNYPWISFKIFWETEFKYDGIVLQYSLNGGVSWTNVGAYNDPVNCLNDNWFNYNNITWLTSASPKHGWSGRVGPTSGSCQGGNGSGGWVIAKHCMSVLANKPSVRFRFLFGSGTTCNGYDGVAIDDILIQDAAPNTANFSYTCTSSSSVNFTNLSNVCSTSYNWNFGDPLSGASNNSTANNPSHTFSGPGTYNVTLTANGTCNAPGIFTKTITILPTTITSTNVGCNGGNDGFASADAIAASYSWNTSPVQTTQTASVLTAGTYTVTISDPNACPTTATVTITEPAPILISFTSSPACNDVCNGSVGIAANGGTPPYTYDWGIFGTSQNINNSMCLGAYLGAVIDANGCSAIDTVTVDSLLAPVIACNDAAVCIGSAAILSATGAVTYVWTPSTGLNTTTGSTVVANPSATTVYTVTGTSLSGCTSSVNVTVTVNDVVAPVAAFSFNPTQANVFDPEVNFINLTSGINTFTWDFNGLDQSNAYNPTYVFPTDSGAIYSVCLIAENSIGCADTVCHEVTIEGFTSIYIPNAFSPNGDGVNEEFFPVVRDVSRENYLFQVFDRWGQIIFSTNSLDAKWDGTFKGVSSHVGVYVWRIKYTEQSNGTNREFNGHFTLLR